jgi:hypothetical protein
MPDSCDTIRDEIAALELQLLDMDPMDFSTHPPSRDPLYFRLQNQLNRARRRLAVCEGPVMPIPSENLLPDEFLINQPNAGKTELFSPNREFKLSFRSDLDLVLYRTAINEHLWRSNTSNPGYPFPGPVWVAYMQSDGNFVIQVRGNTNPRNVIFATNTHGNPGSKLAVQDDGNVVIYSPSGTAIWATNTAVA